MLLKYYSSRMIDTKNNDLNVIVMHFDIVGYQGIVKMLNENVSC